MQGVASVLIVHEKVLTGYPWLFVQSSWTVAKLNLDLENLPYQCAIQGWVTRSTAVELFKATGIKDYFGTVKNKDFRPIPMGMTAFVSVKNEIKRDADMSLKKK